MATGFGAGLGAAKNAAAGRLPEAVMVLSAVKGRTTKEENVR